MLWLCGCTVATLSHGPLQFWWLGHFGSSSHMEILRHWLSWCFAHDSNVSERLVYDASQCRCKWLGKYNAGKTRSLYRVKLSVLQSFIDSSGESKCRVWAFLTQTMCHKRVLYHHFKVKMPPNWHKAKLSESKTVHSWNVCRRKGNTSASVQCNTFCQYSNTGARTSILCCRRPYHSLSYIQYIYIMISIFWPHPYPLSWLYHMVHTCAGNFVGSSLRYMYIVHERWENSLFRIISNCQNHKIHFLSVV